MELIQLLPRALQLLWLVLLTALIGNVIANNVNASGAAESAVNFSMFVVVLSWLAALYGLVAASSLAEALAAAPLVLLAADGLAALFALIAGIVLAAKVGETDCANTANRGAAWIGYGSADDQKRCREVQAAAVFMWFLFATFAAGMAVVLMTFRRGGVGGSRFGGPSMTQVRPGV